MKANFNLTGRMYKQGSNVYIGYTPITVLSLTTPSNLH